MLNQSSGIDWLHTGTKQVLEHEQKFHRNQNNIYREKRGHINKPSARKHSDLGGNTQQQHEEGEFIKSFVATQNTRPGFGCYCIETNVPS